VTELCRYIVTVTCINGGNW